MTTRQSTTLHMSGDGDDPNNGLAFSTIDTEVPQTGEIGEYEPVLEVWGTIEAPDGQVLTAKMQHSMPDVRDLQAFLNDNYARNKAPKAGADATLQTQVDGANAQYFKDGWNASLRELLEMGKVRGYEAAIEWAKGQLGASAPVKHEPTTGGELPGMWEPSDLSGGESDSSLDYYEEAPLLQPGTKIQITPLTATMPDGETKPGYLIERRQCAVIYNGVQCVRFDGHTEDHMFTVDWAATVQPAQHQPDVDLFQEQATAIMTADGAAHAAEAAPSTNAPRFILGPQNAAEQGRKRRLKLEMAFDDAADKYKVDPDNPGVVAVLNEAAVALHKREPNNSRVVNFLFDPTSAPQPAAAQPAAPEQLPEAHFAPEPSQPPAYQPIRNNGYDPNLHAAEEQMEQESVLAQQAAQAFPCPHAASDGRPCMRPAGHEIELPNRPAVPHVYAMTPSMLAQQHGGPVYPDPAVQQQTMPNQPPPYVAPSQPFQQPHLQAVPDPQPNMTVMAFHEGEPGMPAAPAMPTWQAPQQ